MKLTINDRECCAKTGDRLLDAARANHSHIGYFCGGNAICQTCYVKVLEGGELLSPMTSAEKAMLSEQLIAEGTRMACQATIEKPGRISILTTVEEARRMTLERPWEVPAYMGKMGREAAVKFTDTMAFQARRDAEGYQVDPVQLIADVISGIGDALRLVVDALQSLFGRTEPVPATVDGNSCQQHPADHGQTSHHTAISCDARIAPEIARLQEPAGVACN